MARLRLYVESSHGSGPGLFRDYLLGLWSWVPGLPGMALRSGWDRFFLGGSGAFARERGVRIQGSSYIRIDEGAYLDRDTYLHGRPGGLRIGSRTRVMTGAVLHVYNFRGLSGSGIEIGPDCVIGMGAIITGQGGVYIEDKVIIAPRVMVLPVNHDRGDSELSIREQGISALGIRIKKGAWLG
ncbi:MAG: acyltransferase, partial [bacterium]